MTKEDLQKIFDEVHAEVYSPEYRSNLEEQIKNNQHIGDDSLDRFGLLLLTQSELNKAFTFKVLLKALCSKS